MDAVVTDLSMPGIGGIPVIQAVRNRLPNVPAIPLTGHAEDAAKLALNKAVAGSISLLCKPVSNVQLLDCLGTMSADIMLDLARSNRFIKVDLDVPVAEPRTSSQQCNLDKFLRFAAKLSLRKARIEFSIQACRSIWSACLTRSPAR